MIERGRAEAKQTLWQDSLVDAVVLTGPPDESEWDAFDFHNQIISTIGQQMPGQFKTETKVDLPPMKSPGFLILAEILGGQDGALLKTLVSVLKSHDGIGKNITNATDGRSDGGIASTEILAELEHRTQLAVALFNDTPPTMMSAKSGTSGSSVALV